MKVAYFINQYPKVSHTFIRREILALERLGIDVERFALRGWSELTPDPVDSQERARTRYILQNGVLGLMAPALRTIVTSPRRLFSALRLAMRLFHRSDRRILRRLVCLAEACRLVAWLRESEASHLHVHFGTNSAEVGMYARCLGGPPFSFTVHGPEEFESLMGLPEKVGQASFVAAISSYGRSQLYLRCKFSEWPKIQVVRCGIEPTFHQLPRAAPQLSHRFVCVGRLCEAKGQLLLIEAAARLLEKGLRLEVVLAGDGPLRPEIEAAIASRGIGRHVRITGWISSDGVRDEILAARALVLPSFAEGLPVVIMEALSLRTPVLSTYVAGIPELVRSGENGWLFPAGSLDDLTAAMEDCLTRSDEQIRYMGIAGFERVIENHSIDVEAAKLAALFRSGAALRSPKNKRAAEKGGGRRDRRP